MESALLEVTISPGFKESLTKFKAIFIQIIALECRIILIGSCEIGSPPWVVNSVPKQPVPPEEMLSYGFIDSQTL